MDFEIIKGDNWEILKRNIKNSFRGLLLQVLFLDEKREFQYYLNPVYQFLFSFSLSRISTFLRLATSKNLPFIISILQGSPLLYSFI
jgi:hypothetical protein